MNETYRPYEPLNALKAVAPDIWVVDGPEIRMDYFGVGLPFPTRMTIIRLPDDSLWIHSPTEPTPELFAAVAGLGPIMYLIAPNSIHYWWTPDWYARFPEARVSVAPGTSRRAERAKRSLPPHSLLTAQADPAWTGVIDQMLAPGRSPRRAIGPPRRSRAGMRTTAVLRRGAGVDARAPTRSPAQSPAARAPRRRFPRSPASARCG